LKKTLRGPAGPGPTGPARQREAEVNDEIPQYYDRSISSDDLLDEDMTDQTTPEDMAYVEELERGLED
jgi:hypothetical protein